MSREQHQQSAVIAEQETDSCPRFTDIVGHVRQDYQLHRWIIAESTYGIYAYSVDTSTDVPK